MTDQMVQEQEDEMFDQDTGEYGYENADQEELQDEINQSMLTKDMNLEDALENMKMLQDMTVAEKHMQRGGTAMEGAGFQFEYVDENLLKGLEDFDLKKIKSKRFAEMIPQERVVMTLYMINNQVDNIDNLVQRVCAESEQDFLNAYRGHMGMIMRELKQFRNKINANMFEMTKNKVIKNLKAESEYFKQEALHYKDIDKLNNDFIKQAKNEMEGLRDDTYVLRQALLNTKTKQKACEKQLETMKTENLDLMMQVQSLRTQLREQMVSYQKKELIQTALNDDYLMSQTALLSQQQFQTQDNSARITNIRTHSDMQSPTGQPLPLQSQTYDEAGNATVNSVQHGGGVVSLINETQTTNRVSSAPDEQGIRAFLFKLLNSKHIFTNNDIVDQIEAFVQIKMDKCNQMIQSFRDRLSKAEKENRRILMENKKYSSDQFNVAKVFKECLDQLKSDKRKQDHQAAYQNPTLVRHTTTTTEVLNQSMVSAGIGGHHTQRRVHKRIQSAHARKISGTTTASANSSRIANKLTQRHSQPSKGIYVLKSKIGQQSQRERKTTAAVEPIDEVSSMQNRDIAQVQKSRTGRNSGQARAFQTLEANQTVPLVGPSPEQFTMQQQDLPSTIGSPQLFSEREVGVSSNISHGQPLMAAQDKRQIVENFLKDEHVFQLLYDTVFASPMETVHAQETRTLKSNSRGQNDQDGRELSRKFVNQVSDANEQLFEAVVQGSSNLPPQPTGKSRVHRRNQSQSLGVRGHRPTGSFFMSETATGEAQRSIQQQQKLRDQQHSQILALIEGDQDPASDNTANHGLDDNRDHKHNSSQTFFVTLQEATANAQKSRRPSNKEQIQQNRAQAVTPGDATGSPHSQTHTLRGSQQDLDSPQAVALAIGVRKSTDHHQSKEVEDEVNQLFDEDVVNPLAQAASNGNLNVQTLIDQSKNMNTGSAGRAGKPVRPQSSRPMFRTNFMTLDPSSKRLGGGAAAMGRDSNIDSSNKRLTNQLSRELNFQSGVNIHSIQEDSNDNIGMQRGVRPEAVQSPPELEHNQAVMMARATNYESNMNLPVDSNEPKSAMQRRPVPGPSLMMKDRSDFIYHMLELETRGRISQKAVNQKHLSPRSSRLLASRHFMNRNSTAGSSGFGNNQKRGSEGSSLVPAQVLLRDPTLTGTPIGKTRPMSSKVPKAPQSVNTKFKLQRQRLGSAKIRSNLQQRGGMFQGGQQQQMASTQEQLLFQQHQPNIHRGGVAALGSGDTTAAAGDTGNLAMRPAILSATSSNTFFNQPQR